MTTWQIIVLVSAKLDIAKSGATVLIDVRIICCNSFVFNIPKRNVSIKKLFTDLLVAMEDDTGP